MYVCNHMDTSVRPIDAAQKVDDALASMERHRIPCVPVEDAKGSFCGIVTQHEALKALRRRGSDILTHGVLEVVTWDTHVLEPDDPIENAVEIFCQDRLVTAIPVVVVDQLLGMLWRNEVLLELAVMLGIDSPGAFVEAEAPDQLSDFVLALDALSQDGTDVLNIVYGRLRDDGDQPVLRLRVARTARRRVERALHQKGLMLLLPEIEQRPGRHERNQVGTVEAQEGAPTSLREVPGNGTARKNGRSLRLD